MEAKIEGLDSLFRQIGKLDGEITKQATEGMKRAGLNIIADAQQNLRANKSVVFGQLRQSGRVQEVRGENSVDIGFFAKDSETGYAEYVEYGTRGAPARKRIPPPAALAMWGKRKFGMKDEEAESFGWAMAFRIFKNGTKPKAFFAPAVEKNMQQIAKVMSTAIKQMIDKLH